MSDDDLQKAFGRMRRDDERRAPPLEELVRRGAPRRAPSPWAIVVPITSVAAVAAVLLLWCRAQDAAPPTSASAPAFNRPAAAPLGGEAVSSPMGGVLATTAPAADPEPLGFLLALPGSPTFRAASTLGEVSP